MKTIRVLWTTLLIMALAHIVTAQTPITLQFPPRDLGELNKMPVSGVLYERLATQFIGRTGHPLPHGHATSPNATSRTTRGLVPAPERAPFKAASEESVISTTNIDNDSSFDVEPSIIKQTSSGASAAILVHTKFTGTPGAPFNYYYSNKSGGPYTGQLTGPTGYAAYSGDPFLAESQLDSGQSQRRVYLAALVGDNSVSHTGIAVWYSDNLGQGWTLSSNLVNSSTTSTVVLDKPACDVSQYSSSAGYLFVSYGRFDSTTSPTTYEIHCARSTNGGTSFDQDVVVYSSSHFLNIATVIVAPTTGYVYVTWVDYSANPQRIYLAKSQTSGSLSGTWTIDGDGPTGYFFTSTTDTLNGNLRGVTVPMVRYDWPATKISVVWHEKESSTSHLADVYYASKGTLGWQSKVKISNESNCGSHTDQFMPALDYDGNGDLIVTYYDRQGNCNNNLYDLYFTKISASGSQIQGPTKASTFPSNPADNTFTNPDGTTYEFIGDYQQIWSGDESTVIWHSAWIGAPTMSNSDCYYTQIQ